MRIVTREHSPDMNKPSEPSDGVHRNSFEYVGCMLSPLNPISSLNKHCIYLQQRIQYPLHLLRFALINAPVWLSVSEHLLWAQN